MLKAWSLKRLSSIANNTLVYSHIPDSFITYRIWGGGISCSVNSASLGVLWLFKTSIIRKLWYACWHRIEYERATDWTLFIAKWMERPTLYQQYPPSCATIALLLHLFTGHTNRHSDTCKDLKIAYNRDTVRCLALYCALRIINEDLHRGREWVIELKRTDRSCHSIESKESPKIMCRDPTD